MRHIGSDIDEFHGGVASLLTKAGLESEFDINPLYGGNNNKVLRVDLNGSQVCLKAYFKHPDDPRDRMSAEFAFASFAWDKGIRALPKPIVCDKNKGLALYEFVHGCRLKPEDITADKVQQAFGFYCDLNRFKTEPEAISLAKASESCFSIASHLQSVERRIDQLSALKGSSPVEKKVVQFIHQDLLTAWVELKVSVYRQAGQWGIPIEEEIGKSDRRLSPSDFGFHNAILAADGQLRFIDFEYAGWDDPAKLVCDFFCQPAVPVPLNYYAMFAEKVAYGLSEPEEHMRRMKLLLPVHQIKWCCILLNEFLPTGWGRRRFADESVKFDVRKEQQLQKARNALKRLSLLCDRFSARPITQ